MTTDQSNHLDMYNNVVKHAEDNQPITDTVEAFANGIVSLKNIATDISQTAAEQEEPITGPAEEKAERRKTLDETTYSIIAPVFAYANSEGDKDLAAKMNFSQTEIRKIADDKIVGTATKMKETVSGVLSALGPVAITSADLDEWQQDIDNYKEYLEKPRQAVVHRTSLTEDLELLFEDATQLLVDILDPLSIKFKKNHPHYFEDYQNSRKIVDSGRRTTRIAGTVTDAVTGSGLYPANVTIHEIGLVLQTDINGTYGSGTVPIGNYTATAEAEGYVPETKGPFRVKLGTTERVDFALQAE